MASRSFRFRDSPLSARVPSKPHAKKPTQLYRALIVERLCRLPTLGRSHEHRLARVVAKLSKALDVLIPRKKAEVMLVMWVCRFTIVWFVLFMCVCFCTQVVCVCVCFLTTIMCGSVDSLLGSPFSVVKGSQKDANVFVCFGWGGASYP